jgi:hypothetical protein
MIEKESAPNQSLRLKCNKLLAKVHYEHTLHNNHLLGHY